MKLSKLAAQFRAISQQTGRSSLSLVIESLRLRRGVGQVGLSEYVDFGLARASLPDSEKARFAGYRAQSVMEELLVDEYSRILCLDKLCFSQLMAASLLAVPHIHALYSPTGRHFTGTVLRSPRDLGDWLARSQAYPLYAKPCFGVHGRQNATLLACDGTNLTLLEGKKLPVIEFCERLSDPSGFGWLIQESLRPHPDIARMCGERISGVRAYVFLTHSGPRVLIGIWKINSGLRDADNFLNGDVGNLVAEIDIANGRIIRIGGVGIPKNAPETHPVTGERLMGITLPDWSELLDLLSRAATLFPGFLYQAWDIALTDRGPVAMEVNDFGDVDLPQFATGKGFLSEDLMLCLRERGLEQLLVGGSRLAQVNRNGRRGRRRAHWAF